MSLGAWHGGTNANVSGERLVNFDIQSFAPNGEPIAYNRASKTRP